jgi:hypothetical protein
MHLGEFRAFEQTEEGAFDNGCAETMVLDCFRGLDP